MYTMACRIGLVLCFYCVDHRNDSGHQACQQIFYSLSPLATPDICLQVEANISLFALFYYFFFGTEFLLVRSSL